MSSRNNEMIKSPLYFSVEWRLFFMDMDDAIANYTKRFRFHDKSVDQQRYRQNQNQSNDDCAEDKAALTDHTAVYLTIHEDVEGKNNAVIDEINTNQRK